MSVKPKSERLQIAERIAEFIVKNGINRPFGGDVSLYRGGKMPYYVTAFSLPRTLDGTVSVYSPTFIQVRFNTSFRSLPASDSRVFASERLAIEFLDKAFCQFEFDAALEVVTL